MKKLFLLLLVQTLCLTITAGNINKLYRSALTDKGMLYFLDEQKMPKCKAGASLKPLLFDVTYLTSNDTVSIKSTVISLQAYKNTAVTIEKSNGQKITVPTEVIYRDLKGKGYKNHIEIKIPKETYLELYNDSQPFIIDFGDNNRFGFSAGKWAKHRQDVNRIWEIILLNK